MRDLLADDVDVLFVCGCSESQARLHAHFTHVLLLSAPPEVLVGRIRAREDNPYGKRPEELAEILRNLEAVEPIVRRRAHHEVVTTMPPDEVVDRVLELTGEAPPGRDAAVSGDGRLP